MGIFWGEEGTLPSREKGVGNEKKIKLPSQGTGEKEGVRRPIPSMREKKKRSETYISFDALDPTGKKEG